MSSRKKPTPTNKAPAIGGEHSNLETLIVWVSPQMAIDLRERRYRSVTFVTRPAIALEGIKP